MTIEEIFQKAQKKRTKGDYSKAIELFSSLLERSGVIRFEVLALIASCYYNLEKYELALKNYKLAQSLRPDFEIASLGIFLCLEEMNQEENAVQEMVSFLEIYKPKLYISTIGDLLEDLEKGRMLKYDRVIREMAHKNMIEIHPGKSQ